MDPLTLSATGILGTAALAAGGLAVALGRRARRLERERNEARAEVERLERLAALGEMAAGFAHSFNDVLTPILGRTQLLRQRVHDGQLREWLGTIEEAALNGARTVRRIQEYLRQQRGEPTAGVDLAQVVRDAIAEAAPRRPGVHVRTTLGPLPRVRGDGPALRQALGHLVLNALEASPEGGVVSVAGSQEGGEAVVSVTDSGQGMTPATQARMFEPFFTTKPGAAGLGLCLAQAVLSRHGAQLEVETAPGRGTTVRVRIPAEGVGRGPARPGASGPRPTPPGASRCLVVDDDPQVRELIRDVLANAGHAVVTAEDGADGAEKFRAGTFDLVITDLAMPRLNGLQLARLCKVLRPAVPVVMLTGWGVLLTEQELAEHGVDEVLTKPVRVDQVLGAVAAARARTAEA
jgi:CheY-like chemotaxis protein/two-component sensor histidine kinase